MSVIDEQAGSGSGHVEMWIAAARDGSSGALGQLLDGVRDYLLLVANQEIARNARPKVAPSDVVQDSLVIAQDRFGQFRGNTERELFAWLRRIITNQMANVHRDLHRDKRNVTREKSIQAVSRRDPAMVDQAKTPATQAMVHEETVALQASLAALPEEYRQVIMLRNWERMTFAAIGDRLGRTEGAAQKLWYRSIQKLREQLENLDASL